MKKKELEEQFDEEDDDEHQRLVPSLATCLPLTCTILSLVPVWHLVEEARAESREVRVCDLSLMTTEMIRLA